MGMMFSKKPARGEGAEPSKPSPAGRERLHHFDAELAKARACVVDLETRMDRLSAIVVDAEVADRELQNAIAADGGVALAAYAAGQTASDDPIAKLVTGAETTAKAASAAKAALPTAQAALDAAGAEVTRLAGLKETEIVAYLTLVADNTARAYKKAFEELCRLHDELTGFALGVGSAAYVGEVVMIVDPIKTPRFNLPSTACTAEHDPFIRHQPNDLTIENSTATWLAVKSRLELDVDADLSDLVSTEAEK